MDTARPRVPPMKIAAYLAIALCIGLTIWLISIVSFRAGKQSADSLAAYANETKCQCRICQIGTKREKAKEQSNGLRHS
jgi:hypothetical protein